MKKHYLIIIIFFIFSNKIFSLEWKVFGDLSTPRNHPQAVKINDYEALVIGGLDNNGTGISSCEIINIKDSTIKSTASLNQGRGWFTTVKDNKGNIYAIGGLNSGWVTAIKSIEKYNISTKKWAYVGNLLSNRAVFASIFLNDSLILIVGGESDGTASISSCEIFNINTGKSRFTARYPYELNHHILGRTSNDEIICVGGRVGRINSTRTDEIYKFNVISESWSLYGKTNSSFINPSGLKLSNGKFIFSGGCISESPLNFVDDIYFDQNSSFKLYSKMQNRRNWHKLAEFNDSLVVIVGGYDDSDQNILPCEFLNTKTGLVTDAPSLLNSRRTHVLVSLKNPKDTTRNSILCIGGGNYIYSTSLSSVEILQDETIYKNNPPVITEKVKSCNEYKLTIESEGGFKSFNLIDSLSFNITMGSWEFINPNKAIFKLKLIDQSKFGKFSLKITNSSGLITIFIDSINNKGFNIINEHNTTTNINAYPKQDTIVLTTNNYYYRGSAWLNEKQIISQEFSMNFSFLYRDGINSNCDDHSELGADGIALVFQNSNNTVCGAYGGGIGYASLNNALALEFDTFRNDSTQIIDYNDPNGNHFAIQHSKGTISPLHDKDNTLLLNSKIPLLTNGTVYNVNIDYNVEPNTLRVFLDSAGQNNREIANLKNFKFEDYINLDNGKAYIGFTSSTGCATAIHEIFNWNLCSTRITEVEDEPTTNISIYPNPAEDNITFLTDNNISKFEIFNYIGENMPISLISDYNNQIGKITVDISKLNPGLYFIKMGNKYTKFIKK